MVRREGRNDGQQNWGTLLQGETAGCSEMRKSRTGDAHPEGREERINEGSPSLELVRHAEPHEMGFIGSVLDRDEDRSYIRGRRRCEAVHDHVGQ